MYSPMAAPSMMPMMAYPQQFAAPMTPVNAQVRERTGIGWTLDVFRIPIPYVRLIPVQKPAEVTFQMPVAQPQPASVMPVASMAMPMAPMAMPMAAPMTNFAAPSVAMIPQASIGYQQVTTQSQVPFQQAALLQATGQAQAAAPPAAAPPTVAAAAPPSSAALQEQLRQCEQKLKELQELRGKEQKEKAILPRDESCPK
jgi:hypothetical protein